MYVGTPLSSLVCCPDCLLAVWVFASVASCLATVDLTAVWSRALWWGSLDARSFKGTLWSYSLGKPPFDVRQELLQLHNGDDIVVVDKASSEAAHYDYLDLLSRSRFGLVPRGGGLHSYRFVEVLAAGAIPVVLADDWVIPFVEVLRPDMYVWLPPCRVCRFGVSPHMVFGGDAGDAAAAAVAAARPGMWCAWRSARLTTFGTSC